MVKACEKLELIEDMACPFYDEYVYVSSHTKEYPNNMIKSRQLL